MKLKAIRWNDLYLIEFNGWWNCDAISEQLNIPYENYIEILQKYGASNFDRKYVNYYFKKRAQAKKAIEVLEPYAVMAALTEE